MAEKLKPVKITWKEEEDWICEYTWEHSSPSAWIKDLIKAEHKRIHGEEAQKQIKGPLSFLDE